MNKDAQNGRNAAIDLMRAAYKHRYEPCQVLEIKRHELGEESTTDRTRTMVVCDMLTAEKADYFYLYVYPGDGTVYIVKMDFTQYATLTARMQLHLGLGVPTK